VSVTWEIALVFLFLAATAVLFSLERLRVDVVAILIMLGLAWAKLVTPAEAFSGLSSNAVIAVIGVMIMSFGLDRAGALKSLTRLLTRTAGASEGRLMALVSSVVAALSAFMQNVGAAALFLPLLVRMSRSGRFSLARLLMPMGFAAILGGTLTMVGSGPLIILNDLLKQNGLEKFGLFGVTPVGLVLTGAGIGYFLVFRRAVLPERKRRDRTGAQEKLIETWNLPQTVHHAAIPAGSRIVGLTREETGLGAAYGLNLLAILEGRSVLHAPWRYSRFAAGQTLILLGRREDAERFVRDFGLDPAAGREQVQDLLSTSGSGFAEVIIPSRSKYAGLTLRDMAMRKTFAVEPIALLSGDREPTHDFSDQPFKAGDTFVVFGPWENIRAMDDKRDFVVLTPVEEAPPSPGTPRPLKALLCFAGAIALVLAGVHLSLALLSGALAMVLLRVISIDDAYRAIDWRTVFLLAGLIPLGVAMDRTGAAAYVAGQLMHVLHGHHPLFLLAAVAILSTVFSLFMSNVAAAVLLVPLAINMAKLASLDPRMLALLVAVCASNSFVLPTHQVNALLMGPGGYRNADYLRAGGIMTVLFLVLAVGTFYLFYF
jgi:di/tricarboxylate transporter